MLGRGARICGFVGHYGSGKTELALNWALEKAGRGEKTVLVDVDIVNPFFRSAEQHELLARHGVELIAPTYALSAVDLPVLPAEVARVFDQPALQTIFDVGGDDAGAAALGRYHALFEREGYGLYYVVNPYRPRSSRVDEILSMIERVEARSRLRVTGLINNANLAAETQAVHLEHGQALLEQVSARCGLPIVAASGMKIPLEQARLGSTPRFVITRQTVPEWMETI